MLGEPEPRRRGSARPSKAAAAPVMSIMEIQVEGQDPSSPEDYHGPGWITPRSRGRQNHTNANANAEPRLPQKQGGALRRRVIRAARMPAMPRDFLKVIVRPRGGLNLRKASMAQLLTSICHATNLTAESIQEDCICPNLQQNIIVIGTNEERHAQVYAAIRVLRLAGKDHETFAYRAAVDGTSKGVIRGFVPTDTLEDIRRLVVTPKNPTVIDIQRLGTEGAFTILFEGLRVPNYIYVGAVLTRCTLYRKQLDICTTCGRVGHRRDVCTQADTPLCRGCGLRNPPQDHFCDPVCKLCGGAHMLGDRACKKKFQVPYVVRRRRWNRQQQEHEGRQEKQPDPPRGRSPSRRRSRSSTRSRSRSHGRSRSGSANRGVTWADRARGPQNQVRKDALPEHDKDTIINELRKENQHMREQLHKLQIEVMTVKRQQTTSRAPNPTNARAANSSDSHEEAAGAPPNKRKAADEPPLRDLLISFQTEMRDVLAHLSARLLTVEQHIGLVRATPQSSSPQSQPTSVLRPATLTHQ